MMPLPVRVSTSDIQIIPAECCCKYNALSLQGLEIHRNELFILQCFLSCYDCAFLPPLTGEKPQHWYLTKSIMVSLVLKEFRNKFMKGGEGTERAHVFVVQKFHIVKSIKA
ncbi:hypothetical protein AB6A40_006288 [Gnathostoma spinigerum]|uniref:Uncharacterized protein n=1 Tax=Gnathostoma spinigerum TaxID=75299 RepID=A0ABD6EQL9_9BILA